MRRGEVWWVDFSPAVGGEIQKRRPAVIISIDCSNRYLNRVQVVPTTSKAAADQLTTEAKARLIEKPGQVSAPGLAALEHALRVQLGLLERRVTTGPNHGGRSSSAPGRRAGSQRPRRPAGVGQPGQWRRRRVAQRARGTNLEGSWYRQPTGSDLDSKGGAMVRRRTSIMLFAVLLTASTCLPVPGRAQGTFPRDGDEALALRLYNRYRADRARLAQLEAEQAGLRRDIQALTPAGPTVAHAIPMEDVARLNWLNERIPQEQETCRQLEAFWERNRAAPGESARSFAGRYGELSHMGERGHDPKYDRIETAMRRFPFNVTTPPPTSPVTVTNRGSSPFDGLWHTHRIHTGCCGYSADADLTISTDANGVTSIGGEVFSPGSGRVTGNSFSFGYGPGNTGSFTLGDGGKSFSGSFADKAKHRGTVQGRR